MPVEKTVALHNVIIHIKSVLNKGNNHYYDKIFSEKCSYQLAKHNQNFFFDSIITARFGQKEIAKETLYAAIKPTTI